LVTPVQNRFVFAVNKKDQSGLQNHKKHVLSLHL